MESKNNDLLRFYELEYGKMKDEQKARIGFRDNLIYALIAAVGSLLIFSISNPKNDFVLMVIPWICILLGWTYLANDFKISAIGRYFRKVLSIEIKRVVKEIYSYEMIEKESESIFGWETVNRLDKHRKRRKIEQLIIDEFAFVATGIISLIIYWQLVPQKKLGVIIFIFFELILLVFLGIEIFIYADIRKGK